MFLARMATLRAIYRNEAHAFNPDRKVTHWGSERLTDTLRTDQMRSLCKQSKQAVSVKPHAVAAPNIADGQ
jgi:hypothetical protein